MGVLSHNQEWSFEWAYLGFVPLAEDEKVKQADHA
jgi:hypothetical protein